MLGIARVEEGSVAEDIGIEEGDAILTINNREINDLLDYRFNIVDRNNNGYLYLKVKKADGLQLEIEAEVDEGVDVGLEFSPIEAEKCKNSCIFCFVKQLPKGLRESVYVKDEDFRLSFLYGNYVTLAQVERHEIERIKTQKLSPIYISIHSTNPATREFILGVKPKWEILSLMKDLAGAGISMHGQIVVCPGINDGSDLKKSINDLYLLYPSLVSLAIVPVGLTLHRDRLTHVAPVDSGSAKKILDELYIIQHRFKEVCGSSFVFAADELYLKAGYEIPGYEHYEDFCQLENGVGLLSKFKRDEEEIIREDAGLNFSRLEWGSEISKEDNRLIRDCIEQLQGRSVSVVTGVSPERHIGRFIDRINSKFGIEAGFHVIRNTLFGETVTVTGLIPGKDVVSQLSGLERAELGDVLLVPDIALKDGGDRFIDNISIEEVGKTLGVEVSTFDSTPYGFIDALREGVF